MKSILGSWIISWSRLITYLLACLGKSLEKVLNFESINLYQPVINVYVIKVSVKENEVPTEKISSRASIFATKASYISN